MLLAYLACKRVWVSRDEIAALIWPEADSSTRLTRLRQMLRYIEGQGWCPDLEVERLRLRWSQGSDVHGLQRAWETGDWLEATQLYTGPLLVGLDVETDEPYGNWLAAERRRLRTLWMGAAKQAALHLEERERVTEALQVWEAILHQDGLAEDALCELLRICLACGQIDRGFAAYTVFQQRLWSEHRLEPRPSTHAWLDRLRQAAENTPPQTGMPMIPLLAQDPMPTTVFVGRDRELTQLVQWLDSEATGVLTLVGPGGVGKTRLAMEAIRRSSCPSVFVPLVSLLKGQSVLAAVAQAMGKPLRGVNTAEEEVRALLQDARVALILDNAEHLMEEVAGLVSLVKGFGQVKLLTTSRVRMALPGEQVLELGGLSLEPANGAEAPALSLLFHAVRRARPGFAWTAYEIKVASRVCQTLDGMPLALELAGGWAKLFSLSEIANRMEQNLDFLEGSLAISERHRGLRVVFAHSWQLLSDSERKALCRLAMFEGGFEVGAGLEIAQVSHQDLLSLVDKAMLKIVGENQRRGDVHPLILEYACEQITPNQREQMLERHARYFLRFAEEVEPKLHGPEQIEWMEHLEQDHPNLRLALRWWMDSEEVEGALRMTSALRWFWYLRGHYREGLGWIEQALALNGADQHPSQYAEALRCAGAFLFDLSEYPRAGELFSKALELFEQLQVPGGIAYMKHHLGLLAREQGDLENAIAYLQESIATRRLLGNTYHLASSLNDLAITHAQRNELGQARPLFEESLTLKEAVGDHAGVAYAYNNLGVIAHMENRPFEEVRLYQEKSLDIKRKLGDQLGLAIGLHNLGSLARHSKDPSARKYLSEALTLRQKLGNRVAIAQTLSLFAKLLVDEGQAEKAATIYGFLYCLAEKAGFEINKLLQNSMGELKETLDEFLSAQRFALARASGAALSLEQVVKLVE